MDILNFDELVSDYYTNLHTTLRNFRPGPEYLESWVHDEDVARSVLGIFESASDFGLQALGVKLGKQSSEQLNEAELSQAVAKMGVLSIERQDGEALVVLRLQGEERTSVHRAYQEALTKRAQHLRFQNALSGRSLDGEFILRENIGSEVLSVRVSDQAQVLAAGHASTGIRGALLDVVCQELVGRPIQEGAEHAMIRTEAALRSKTVAPPVPGLVTPQNADPLFAEAETALQNLFATYLQLTGQAPQWNDWEDKISESWKGLSEPERIEAIQRTIETIVSAKGLPYRHLLVVGIKHDTRVVLNAGLYRSVTRFGHDLMQIERELKSSLEPRLELTLESLDDQNRRETRTARPEMSAPPPK